MPRLPRCGAAPFEPCEFGVTGARRAGTFLLIGDSHAMHWRRGARGGRGGEPLARGLGRAARLPVQRADPAHARRSGPAACARLHREAIGWLRAHPEVETVFVSNWAPPGSSPSAATRGGAAAFGAMLDRVPPSVKRVYVLRDIPRTTLRAVDCVRARRRRGLLARACALAARRPSSTRTPRAAAGRGPASARIDLTRFFCGAARCFPVVGGAYVYKDLDHMNAVFATSLGPYLLRALG